MGEDDFIVGALVHGMSIAGRLVKGTAKLAGKGAIINAPRQRGNSFLLPTS